MSIYRCDIDIVWYRYDIDVALMWHRFDIVLISLLYQFNIVVKPWYRNDAPMRHRCDTDACCRRCNMMYWFGVILMWYRFGLDLITMRSFLFPMLRNVEPPPPPSPPTTSLSPVGWSYRYILEVGGWERMRPQPGNRFRFRLRARVVRASEAVRDDSAVAGVRQTFFSCCCSSCCWRADVPRRPIDKNHKSLCMHTKKSCKKRPVFPVKNFVSSRAPKY